MSHKTRHQLKKNAWKKIYLSLSSSNVYTMKQTYGHEQKKKSDFLNQNLDISDDSKSALLQ